MRRKSQLFSAEYAENNNCIIYQMVEQLFITLMPDHFSLMSFFKTTNVLAVLPDGDDGYYLVIHEVNHLVQFGSE